MKILAAIGKLTDRQMLYLSSRGSSNIYRIAPFKKTSIPPDIIVNI